MKCPRCEKELPDQSRFCNHCGTDVRPSEKETYAEKETFVQTKTIQTTIKEIAPGVVFAGKYRIIEELGRGGMGIVYKAEDLKLKRTVALKFLPEEMIRYPEANKRFIREAQAAASLDHIHICTVYEVEEAEDKTYIAMAYIEGENLREKSRKPLSVEETLKIGMQVASGLEEAHKKGIVHRDIKSANIMIDTRDQAKIMDFGLAKVSGDTLMTREGTMMGTIAFMSPEQTRGESVDHRSDIWSLGVVLYKALSGQLPFTGELETSVMYSIVHEEPKPLRDFNPDIPDEMIKIINRSLQKKPESRYQSVSEMLKDLKDYWEILKAPDLGITDLRSFLRVVRRPKFAIPLSIIFLGIAVVAFLILNRQSKIRWARLEALPEIERLAAEDKYMAAYKLALRAERFIPEDRYILELKDDVTLPVTFGTFPPGADIYIKDYFDLGPDGWDYLGKTPLENFRVPRGWLRVKMSKPGYDEARGSYEVTGKTLGYMAPLIEEGRAPPDMVFWGMPLEGKPYRYLIDKYEVTNKQYKEFLDAGGYQDRKFWKHEFIKDGQVIPWEDAMREFIDKTERPGPFTWELGDFPEGQEDYPVSGVSWYEAAAYAEFAGKSLPTLEHWREAFGSGRVEYLSGGSTIIALSNFGEEGLAPVGEFQGISICGVYDMAGNVKEWCWNTTGDNEKISLGGGWNESKYMFWFVDKYPPMMRSSNFGFRCMKSLAGVEIPPILKEPINPDEHPDFREVIPCSDEEFEKYKSLFTYEKAEFDPFVESREEISRNTDLESVSFAAGYDKERVTAHIFLPKRVNPPYQTIVYFPDDSAIISCNSISEYGYEDAEFFTKDSRAVVVPAFKGTLERRYKKLPVPSYSFFRYHILTWYKEMARLIDYLETREEFDTERLAYFGISGSAGRTMAILAVEERIKAAILLSGGFHDLPPEVSQTNFLPRVKIPVIMINGKYDWRFQVEKNLEPMFRLFGTPKEDKYLKLYETGHNLDDKRIWIKDALAFLDKYFGQPQRIVKWGEDK